MVKIAIQGHPTRGKEIIQILESLGGINSLNLLGTNSCSYYYISDNNAIINMHYDISYKIYTLEAFEQKFPFKFGDEVITNNNLIGFVEKLILEDISGYYIRTNNGNYWCNPSSLRLYKEMKEERNITLTLNKAKEWYKKGGELKEVALQAYSEEELRKVSLPKTFEEFCDNYTINDNEAYFDSCGIIHHLVRSYRSSVYDKSTCPSEKSAEAHLALIQLEQLRDCYRQGDIPDFTKAISKYCIAKINKRIDVVESSYTSYFLSFTKKEVAEEYLANFKPLIKIAEDYI